jgi:hypothetical protein
MQQHRGQPKVNQHLISAQMTTAVTGPRWKVKVVVVILEFVTVAHLAEVGGMRQRHGAQISKGRQHTSKVVNNLQPHSQLARWVTGKQEGWKMCAGLLWGVFLCMQQLASSSF